MGRVDTSLQGDARVSFITRSATVERAPGCAAVGDAATHAARSGMTIAQPRIRPTVIA
jgi:hypothetical protein